MKQVYSFLIVLIFPYFIQNSLAQSDDLLVATSQNFLRLYEAGDFINAEKCISDIINSQHKIPERYKIFIYNSMGLTNTQLGKYNDALNYYNMAEKSVATKEDTTMYLGGIYINKAIILGYQKSYNEAIDFFEKGIRIMILNNPVSFGQLSAAYLNLGIFLYESGFKIKISSFWVSSCLS
jgi:tetratricopeptide (TPR) repeat protein